MKSYRYMDPNAMDAQYGVPKQDAFDKGLGGAQDLAGTAQDSTGPRSGLVDQGADAAGVSPEATKMVQSAPDSTSSALSTTTGYAPAAMQGIGGVKGLASSGGSGTKKAAKDQVIAGAESAGAQAASMNPYTAAAYYGGQLLSNAFTGDSIGKNIGKLF